jgi:hypothetical protein
MVGANKGRRRERQGDAENAESIEYAENGEYAENIEYADMSCDVRILLS